MEILKMFLALLGPKEIQYTFFGTFKSYTHPLPLNQLTYLIRDFRKVSLHLKENLLLKRFFYNFKGIVSRDFVVCFLVSFDRSDISSHQERVLLLLKVRFRIEFFDFHVMQ
jgi:hypothetical protein